MSPRLAAGRAPGRSDLLHSSTKGRLSSGFPSAASIPFNSASEAMFSAMRSGAESATKTMPSTPCNTAARAPVDRCWPGTAVEMPVQPEAEALAEDRSAASRRRWCAPTQRRWRGSAPRLRRDALRDGAKGRRLAAQLRTEIDDLGVDLSAPRNRSAPQLVADDVQSRRERVVTARPIRAGRPSAETTNGAKRPSSRAGR